MFSLMYKLADMFWPLTQDAKRQTARLIEGMPLRDWVTARVLEESGAKMLARAYRQYSLLCVQVDELERAIVPDVIRREYLRLQRMANTYINSAIKAKAQTGTRHEQAQAFDYAHSMDPTHTLVAKDDMSHPLHTLSAEMAIEAVADVGALMQRVWNGQAVLSDVQTVARSYFVHPADSRRFDAQVKQWSQTHGPELKTLADPQAMTARAKAHGLVEHGEESDAPSYPLPTPQINQSPWNYMTMHYEEMTGTPDALQQGVA